MDARDNQELMEGEKNKELELLRYIAVTAKTSRHRFEYDCVLVESSDWQRLQSAIDKLDEFRLKKKYD